MSHRFTRPRSRPPFFTPAPVRARRDGWSPQVQCAFLAALYAKGSVAAAAQTVGRSRISAYKLRAMAGGESFAHAWDVVLAGPGPAGEPVTRRREVADWRKLTLQALNWRIETGLWRPVIYRGKMCAVQRKADNSALLHLLARLDRQLARLEEEAL